MRASPSLRDEPSLEMQLAQLDSQLRAFEAAIRAQQERHGHLKALEADLIGVVGRAAALVRELTAAGDRARQAADAATRDALAASSDRLGDFERRAARILDAYANAVRAAQHAVARAEARIEAFDERVARDLAEAGREIREAATLLRERGAETGPALLDVTPVSRARRLIPALLAAALLLGAFATYAWVARTVREASARADAAERQAQDTRREATQQIASIERSAQQASGDALSTAARAERFANVIAAPDSRRTVLVGQGAAAAASGHLLWSRSRGLVISGTRLPALTAGETYQVWLVRPGSLVSLGVLAPDPHGRVSGVFDFPAAASGPIRGFMVTRERAGGSARPSGPVVLAS